MSQPASDFGRAAKRLGIPLWGRVLLLLLVPASGYAIYAWYQLDRQIVGLNSQLASLKEKIDGIDGRFAKQEEKMEKWFSDLMRALLTESKRLANSGDTLGAKRSFKLATTLMEGAKANNLRVGQTYFEQVSDSLNSLAAESSLSPDIHAIRLKLAEYKSALEKAPEPAGMIMEGFDIKGRHIRIAGVQVRVKSAEEVPVRLLPPLQRKLSDEISIQQSIIYGGTQPLDGIHWVNVVFVGTRIRYEGGEADLRKVRFVNCTFDLPPSAAGNQLAEYVARRDALTMKIG